MNARTKPQTRFFAALIAATLFAVAAGLHPTPVDSTQAAGIAARPATAINAAATKPAVHAPAAAVLLPQIVVRPTDAERAAAMADTQVADHSPFVRPGDSAASAGGAIASSPRMNFDMPYYAFGKVRSASPK